MISDVFDLDAGRLCLDFANTLGSSSGEHLHSYADLLAFAEQSGLLTPDRAAGLRDNVDQSAAEVVMARAYQLRAAIYGIFSAIAAGASPDDAALEALNAELARALEHARIIQEDGEYRWGWSDHDVDAPLWDIARSAANVLTNDAERDRVRECSGETCRWLFLDTSKNRSRQWCSMQSCGNREKARRHYQRVRNASNSASTANSGSTS